MLKYNIKRMSVILIIVLVMIPILLVGRGQLSLQYELNIMDQENEQVLKSKLVRQGDEIAFYWIHSVEHTSWVEIFTLEGQQLKLQEIRLQGFGAGIPHERGQVTRVEGGEIIMSQIDEDYESYQWIHSHTATEKITINGQVFIRAGSLPHHGFMKMIIKER
ncbi:Domain of unknown function DUF1850 [Alkaliphilus metalliredigens QYMF]|uniref:DUF1850 domain-containing protein n=1 Tax=Alkaliphilus metalliredigens (strain QYMF) TaxID=293826 RepID=A6TLD7_ALKMQ|nr:DUF1850 domain-containing protein [Alkaliphilus metalliredigens]ABR47005.1 Domain of unknown function DUF1850 [Alkaliphilus metalliredigens QYMF]